MLSSAFPNFVAVQGRRVAPAGTAASKGSPQGGQPRRETTPAIRDETESPARPGVKNAEDILERIFAPTPKASAAEQAERALRRPKQLIYCALSNRNFYWRQHITKFVLDEGQVPIVPFMLFDYRS